MATRDPDRMAPRAGGSTTCLRTGAASRKEVVKPQLQAMATRDPDRMAPRAEGSTTCLRTEAASRKEVLSA